MSLKEAAGSLDQFKQIKALVDDDFQLYSGDDALTLSFVKAGAVGVVSVASHCVGLQINDMINACKAAKRKNILKIITLTGHEKNNPLSKLGDINLWIESKAYNFIENTHQLWLLTVCDLIIGKREYPPN